MKTGTDAAIYVGGESLEPLQELKGGLRMKPQQWMAGQRNQVLDDMV